MAQFHLILCLTIPHLSSQRRFIVSGDIAMNETILTEFPSLFLKNLIHHALSKYFRLAPLWFHCSRAFILYESSFFYLFYCLRTVKKVIFTKALKDLWVVSGNGRRNCNFMWISKRWGEGNLGINYRLCEFHLV